MQVTVNMPEAYAQNPERFAQQIEDTFIDELLSLWRKHLLPAFRKTTPYRTGRLRRSLQIVRIGNRLQIKVKPRGYYWHMQRGLPERYQTIYRQTLPQMMTVAMQRTREKMGV